MVKGSLTNSGYLKSQRETYCFISSTLKLPKYIHIAEELFTIDDFLGRREN